MKNDETINKVLSELRQFKPKSVFLYGSRGRGDATADSDYEIGVVFEDDLYVQRSDIHAAVTALNVRCYPFKWSELREGTFNHVFQKSLFMREIITGGKAIGGEDLLTDIRVLPITTLDLVQRIRFDIGMALAALLSFRSGDTDTSMEEFSKACFFGLRSLIILELKKFPLGYDEIHELATELVQKPEYRKVIMAARAVRTHEKIADIGDIYENISMLDSCIEPKIIAAFKKKGDQILM